MWLAYGFASLFWPDFVEVDGALILAEMYTEEGFQNWYSHFNGDLTAIEKMINHVHLEDLFVNARRDDDLDGQVLDTVLSIFNPVGSQRSPPGFQMTILSSRPGILRTNPHHNFSCIASDNWL